MSAAPSRLAACAVALLCWGATACSFSLGGLDYEELETAIAEELDTSYASIDQAVADVECPEPEDAPGPGDTLTCTADLAGQDVRVEVTVEDEDYNVTFRTIDLVYDLPDTADLIADDISEQLGTPVNLNCGEGVTVVAIGDSFLCTAVDSTGETATVEVTANGAQDTSWEIVE